MKKVAYNIQYGGFGISIAALDRMISLGHTGAVLKKHEMNMDFIRSKYVQTTVHLEYPAPKISRHDPILIQAIEELGEAANGEHATLRIEEMDDRDHYQIKEFDGKETLKILNLHCDCCS